MVLGCEACALSLNDELNDFDILVDVLKNTLGNVSSLALAGGRLKRLQKAYDELNVSSLKYNRSMDSKPRSNP